jgi:hypothetical protein
MIFTYRNPCPRPDSLTYRISLPFEVSPGSLLIRGMDIANQTVNLTYAHCMTLAVRRWTKVCLICLVSVRQCKEQRGDEREICMRGRGEDETRRDEKIKSVACMYVCTCVQ